MSTSKTKNISIKGLHCRSCEISAEDALCKIPNIKKVNVSHEKGQAEIEFSGENFPFNAVSSNLKKLGYSIDDKKDKGSNKDKQKKEDEWSDFFIAIIIVSVMAIIIKFFGWINISQEINKDFNYFSALVVGLIAGVSTCLVLVGGLILASAADFSKKHPNINGFKKFEPHLIFNLGRVLGFFVLGGLLGLIGSAFQISTLANAYLSVIIGLVIIFLGIKVLDLFPFFNKDLFLLPKRLARFLGVKKENKEYKKANVFISGILSFFLPCGFTQAMQIYAISTGNFIGGALTLSIFALGTMPGLLSLGGIVSLIKGKKSGLLFKIAGLIIIILGLINIINAAKLISFFNNKQVKEINNSQVINTEKQIIRMEENSRGYKPNILKVEVNRPVTWIIDAKEQFSCASSFVVPSLGIEKRLQPGENVIEFTPTKIGKINFSCSMGMYTGYIQVVAAKK